MRRRLFWTIAGVSMVMGSLVLVASLVSSQRAARDATQRELERAATEVVAIIEEAIERGEERPLAMAEVFALLENDQFAFLLGRLVSAAGGSDLSFAAVAPNGEFLTNGDVFSRLNIDLTAIEPGDTRIYSAENNDLVVVTGTELTVNGVDLVFIAALARNTPVVRLSDRSGSMVVIFAGMILASSLLARLLADRTIRSLEPLASASRRVAAGDLSARVPDPGDPELADLVSAFNEMAEQLGDSRVREREFLLGVGHDLRTPLTTIAGYAEALESGEVDSDELLRIGSIIGVQSRHLGRLIEDITLLARLEQPEFDLRLEEVDLSAHVTEVVEAFRRRAEELDITLEVNAEPTDPLETDPDRIAQIAQNLVQNALRFTPASGRITVSVAQSGEGVSLAVEDTGTGISPEVLPNIFDRHFAVGGQRQIRNEGTGLGLSIVKGLAEKLGGSVAAESEKGIGTKITVLIPGVDQPEY
ncbi:MAG TPA: HAMP domain-containing sensor histidine kinase [Acidimicrobiia bacterium]